ncbi:LTA synthase family protein [Pedobacter sp. Leaf194]|uniref:LTA synthase family protein n=1 Tax=Pedobacter sp. Leaf194 TaxID=1736297 RepID=UPI000702D4A8|nr:alkaline phosphatase family protein [Pedobacter sp. Leaf194]KQS38163.1 sulfatase [Pedobacter sp. Leaf194]
MMNLLKGRYAVLYAFIIYFLTFSFLIRIALFNASAQHVAFSLGETLKIFVLGLFYDLGTSLMLVTLYSLFLLLIPTKKYQKKWNRFFTPAVLFFFLVITLFSFFAELTFWQEFESRFNFIAVDYLIYTYEVIHNINESYPLPLLISAVLLIALAITLLFYKLKIFKKTFESTVPFKQRIIFSSTLIAISLTFCFIVKNSWAEHGNNRYANELSKAGIYSFFAAFKNNELNYKDFYNLIDDKEAFNLMRKELAEANAKFLSSGLSIKRFVANDKQELKPNVITITVESLSADFLAHYGNKENLTPFLDSTADNSVFFSNMYATGTRTVRGMEALTLCIPPTPGSSIVRRMDNEHLFSVGAVFKKKGYVNTFFYGGDGYFDNMNHFFGNNGYNIVDRGRKLLNETFDGSRKIIKDGEVTFENAWGICDEDIFNVVIEDADAKYKAHQLFNNFIMTTSNHRPYTFPANKINIPSGTREAAVRYTDYAIEQFIKKIKRKPWFNNTVIVIVADHCASSAGKNEIDISKYQIPCMILNLKNQPALNISKMTSQIDLFATLWHLLGWKYTNGFFSKNVLDESYKPRVVLGTYQKLVYMRNDSMVVLSPQHKMEHYIYNKAKNEQNKAKFPDAFANQAIANYQTAFELFKNGGLKE